jgi:hypothetical protein
MEVSGIWPRSWLLTMLSHIRSISNLYGIHDHEVSKSENFTNVPTSVGIVILRELHGRCMRVTTLSEAKGSEVRREGKGSEVK